MLQIGMPVLVDFWPSLFSFNKVIGSSDEKKTLFPAVAAPRLFRHREPWKNTASSAGFSGKP